MSVTERYLKEQVDEACQMASKENIVKRLNFCIWTGQVTRWHPMTEWDACGLNPISETLLIGRRCFGGLDLASRIDLAALVLVFPKEDGAILCCHILGHLGTTERSEQAALH